MTAAHVRKELAEEWLRVASGAEDTIQLKDAAEAGREQAITIAELILQSGGQTDADEVHEG